MVQSVHLSQLVFGYQDGHRLLAASDDVPEGVATALLVHSDREAGARLSADVGSWTGVPLDEQRVFALLCTWAAPEMPRPGCVWTHALLIRFADIATFPTFTSLRALFVRPRVTDLARFARPTSIDPAVRAVEPALDAGCAESVVQSLYGPAATGQIAPSKDAADLCFAAWAQQWPRLRRGFSFRTGTVDRHALAGTARMMLRVVEGAGSDQTSAGTWVKRVADDLVSSTPTELRRFLWRYGPDMPDGRKAVPFLADLYAQTRQPRFARGALQETLANVTKQLPAPAHGALLKADLMALGRSEYTLLPQGDPLDLLGFYAAHPERDVPPPPELQAFVADAAPTDLLPILEQAITQQAPLAQQLPSLIAARWKAMSDRTDLLSLAAPFPAAQAQLAITEPALLDSDALVLLEKETLSTALASLPPDPALISALTVRLIDRPEPDVISALADANITAVVDVLFTRLRAHFADNASAPASDWIDAVHARIQNATPSRLLTRSATHSEIAACAELIYWDVGAALRIPASAWAAALVDADADVSGDTTRRLFCFLLSVAIARPTPGSEVIFETTFEPVHAYLWGTWGFPTHFWQLDRVLPNLSWWQQWDTCRRLRLGVTSSYIQTPLSTASFLRLADDDYLVSEMIRTAEETRDGRRYIKRLRESVSRK